MFNLSLSLTIDEFIINDLIISESIINYLTNNEFD